VTTHTYDVASVNGYTVTLNVSDNWGYSSAVTLNVAVLGSQAIVPSASIPSGPVYDDAVIVLTSIEPGAAIYYELFQGNAANIDVTPCSQNYTGPIKLPYTAGVTATLLIKAYTGGVPSATVTYVYQMVQPPCGTMGFGAKGTTTAPGQLYCSNTAVPDYNATIVDIPPKDTSQTVYTDAPPPDATKIIVWKISGLNGIAAPPGNLTEGINTTMPTLWNNGGNASGAIIKVMADIDFNGDGVSDRREVFTNIAPNDVADDWEVSTNFLQDYKSRFTGPIVGSQTYQNLVNGSITISIWEAIADNNGSPMPLQVRTGASVLDIKGLSEMSTLRLPYYGVFQFNSRPAGAPLPLPPKGNCTATWQLQGTINTNPVTKTGTDAGKSDSNKNTNAGTSDYNTGNGKEDKSSSSSLYCSIFLVFLALM